MSDVPHLRFPEFTGEWKKYRLDEMGESFIGLTYSPKDVVENEGTIVFRSSNIQNGQIDYSDIVRVSKTIKERIITRENDLLICARNGSPRLIGKNALIKKTDANNTFGAFMMVYRSIDNDFIHPLLSTRRYVSQVGENLGARINQITTSDLNSFEFFFPKNDGEKRKIGKLFDLLNERIATQNKIIEDLKKLKSAIYHKQFSNLQGKEKTLFELAEIIKGQQINGSELSESGKFYVMNGGIVPSGYYDCYNTEADTISISEGGNSCGYVQYNNSKFWSGGHCYTLRIKPTAPIATQFLFHFLKWKEADIMALRIGSGLPNIQKKDLSKICIIVPTLDRQQQQIALLTTFQMKIENEGRYVVNLDKQKQYLLQQMFI